MENKNNPEYLKMKLEQLERLRSDDTPCRLMINHTIESYWSKQTLHATHLLKLLDKMYKYEMDSTGIIEDTERTRFCPQTDRQTDKVKPVYPLFNFVEGGGGYKK